MLDHLIRLNFYGIIVEIQSNDKESITFIESDFSYFLVCDEEEKKSPDIKILITLGEVTYNHIPEGTVAAYHTKDAVVYKAGSTHYYDSPGKGLVIFDHQKNFAEIFSIQRDFLYEKVYLMVMSRVGEILDKKNFHRIHSMGVVYKGKGILCLLPMGGGKTTLTLSLLQNKSFSLLSEEVPLVSNKGLLHPFPIRMGVTKDTKLAIPDEYLKSFNRTHYPPKILIDINFFKDQIAETAEPGLLFIGKRIFSSNPKIIKISKLKSFPHLFRLCVMGMGIPQLLEYILKFDFRDIARQIPLITSRLTASIKLISKSKTFEIHLGYDKKANAAYLTDFIEKHFKS